MVRIKLRAQVIGHRAYVHTGKPQKNSILLNFKKFGFYIIADYKVY